MVLAQPGGEDAQELAHPGVEAGRQVRLEAAGMM